MWCMHGPTRRSLGNVGYGRTEHLDGFGQSCILSRQASAGRFGRLKRGQSNLHMHCLLSELMGRGRKTLMQTGQ